MSEKARFYSMTKPVRFRRFKLLKLICSSRCKALKELILYHSNNILYKLNILDRYSYRDKGDSVTPINPPRIKTKVVTSEHFKGVLAMNCIETKEIDLDYFFKTNKEGKRKITYCVRNKEETRLKVSAHLTNIFINVGGNWFSVDHLPIFKATFRSKDKPPVPCTLEEPLRKPKIDTVTFDTRKLSSLRCDMIIGVDTTVEEVSDSVLQYYYDFMAEKFAEELNSIKIGDLMI